MPNPSDRNKPLDISVYRKLLNNSVSEIMNPEVNQLGNRLLNEVDAIAKEIRDKTSSIENDPHLTREGKKARLKEQVEPLAQRLKSLAESNDLSRRIGFKEASVKEKIRNALDKDVDPVTASEIRTRLSKRLGDDPLKWRSAYLDACGQKNITVAKALESDPLGMIDQGTLDAGRKMVLGSKAESPELFDLRTASGIVSQAARDTLNEIGKKMPDSKATVPPVQWLSRGTLDK